MKSTIHGAAVVNTGTEDRTDLEIKKPYAVFQCSKFMKDVDRAEKYLIYYLDLTKTVHWPIVSAKLCTLQCIFVYRTLNTNKK
jgi:hypothetical protein